MKRFAIEVVLMVGLFAFSGAWAGGNPIDRGKTNLADAGQGTSAMSGKYHGADDVNDRGSFAFGRPGDAGKADRTIRIKALDAMHYDKRELTVRAGETVRFIVTNTGKIRHEFVIGDAAEQHEHEKEMQGMPAGMVMPDEANGISLAPGETKSIVWQFAGPGTIELACHEPGHFEAGMLSRVIVKK